eukprot:TRINITY_DN7505_c0_g1_i4.p1 TRINITY_DN7505_c0_g1~~TRINITY_DN7505_c0_g1_i4.p1  ORF type:complete len:448 (-),score=100.34 TRINITY_DN7505_c0_g1_i4:16-1359(-)
MKYLLNFKHYGQGATYDPLLSQKVSKVLQNVTNMDPGLAVSAGAIALAELPCRFRIGHSARGCRAAPSSAARTPVSDADAFRIGPCATPLIGALIDELQLQRPPPPDLWHLPLGDILPSLPAEWGPTTLDSLLSHRAGIDDLSLLGLDSKTKKTLLSFKQVLAGTYPTMRELWGPMRRQERVLDVLERFLPVPHLVGKFSYSLVGVGLACLVLEEVTKRAFEDLMRENVFGPLGMQSAGFGTPDIGFLHKTPPKEGKVVPNQPWGHYRGLFQRRTICVPPWSEEYGAFSAGDVHLNMQDWLKFLGATIALSRTTSPQPPWYARGEPISVMDPRLGYQRGWAITDTEVPAVEPPLGLKLERFIGRTPVGFPFVPLPNFGEVSPEDYKILSCQGESSDGLWYTACYVDLAAGVGVAVMTNAGAIPSFKLTNLIIVKILKELQKEHIVVL